MRARHKRPRVALQVLICLASVLALTRGEYSYTAQCRECNPGEYCFQAESLCPNHSTLPQGSNNIADCVCIDGYTPDADHNCHPCVAGEFCSGDVVNTCAAAIGPHMTSPPQASASSDCVCVAGYFWTGSMCEACAAGSYKAGDNRAQSCSLCAVHQYSSAVAAVSDAACQDCPLRSESAAGSSAVTDCKCQAGSTGADGSDCTLCLAGTFKPSVGSALCTDCSVLGNLGNSASSQRRLLASLAAIATHSDSVYYSTVVGSKSSNDCQSCATHLSNSRILGSGASGSAASQCECFEGFTLSGGKCVPCAAGTYKDAPGSAACTECLAGKYNALQRSSLESDCVDCPSNSGTSAAGSVALADCICSDGFAGADASLCAECADGSTAIGLGNTVCTLCGYGTYEQDNACVDCSAGQNTTSEGAAFGTQCVCAAGFGIDTSVSPAVCTACAAGTAKGEAGNFECVDCVPGKYQAATQGQSCDSCPDASTNTMPAATSLHTCVCDDGFETSAATANSVTCEPCSAQSYSQHGTIDITGVGTYATKTCSSCAAGEFVRANVCTACGANSGADVALNSSGLCQCAPGYTCTPHRYTVTGISTNSAGLSQFSLQVEETQENAGAKQTLYKAAQEIVLPLHVPVIVDWSAVPSTPVMFGVPTVVLSEYTAPSISDVVVYMDAAKHQTTIVLRKETPVHAVGALSAFAGTPVRTDECPCISCQAGFVKLDDGNACSCELARDGECVKCFVDATFDHSCQQCSAGQYSEANLASTACLLCAPGSYSTVASDTCTGCTGASFTIGSGSASADACLCNAGYYLRDELCISCAMSFYKSSLGNHECTMCPAPLVGTLPTQTTNADCQVCAATEYYTIAGGVPTCAACDPLGCDCPAGYTGNGQVQCSECAQGSWKSSPGSAACTDCPAGYVGHATDRLAQASACVECTAGTYALGQTCVDCGDGKTSVAGSDNVDDCYVLPGFTLDTSGVPLSLVSRLAARGELRAKPCAAGTYKATDGTDPCTQCEDGKFASAPGSVTCDACPENTLQLQGADQTTVVSCVCPAGYMQTASATPTAGKCQACAAGKFTATAGVSECQSCAEGEYFAGPGTGQSTDHCTPCPSDSSSPAGSYLIDSCVCDAGFERTGDACHPCNHNATEVNGVCTQCPLHSAHAQTASSDPTDCVCDDGYSGGYGQACTACGADVYCVAGQQYPCGEFRNTRGKGLKRTSAACICMAGYYERAGVCVPCEVDSYCDMNAITPCPEDSVAVVATANVGGCVCEAGYKAVNDADGNLESCRECNSSEWCAGIVFGFNMKMESSVDDMADADEITRSVSDMLNADDTVVKQVKTQVNFNVVVPSERIILNAGVMAQVDAVSDFTQRAITQNTHSMVVLDVEFANVSPLRATDVVRKSIQAVLHLQTATDEEIASWVNVTSKAETHNDAPPAPSVPSPPPPPPPPTALLRRRRRNLLAVVAFSVQSERIVYASSSDVFLSQYEAYVSIDVSAILQTAYKTDGLLIEKTSIQQRLEYEMQVLSSSSSGSIRRLRRLLTTTEPSATIAGMELDTEVSLETSTSSSQDVMSSETIHAIEANLANTLADSAGAFVDAATTEASVQLDVLVESASDEIVQDSILRMKSADATARYSVAAVGVSTSVSIQCAEHATVATATSDCTCEGQRYCENTSDENAYVQNCVNSATLQCTYCPVGTYCEGDNRKRSCNADMTTLSEGKTSATDCLCQAGFYEQFTDTCVPCGVHSGAGPSNVLEKYYCAVNAPFNRCDATLNFEKAKNQAAAPSDCLCKPGYFRLDEFDTCKPCPRNYYCPEVTSNTDTLPNIFPCHDNAITADVGAESIGRCYCEIGFKLIQDSTTASCFACLTDNLCAVGSTDEDTIVSCVEGTQQNADHTECICNAGSRTVERGLTQHTCRACEAGKVQTLAGQDSCDDCGVGFFAEHANQACVQCATDEEALGSANAQCRCKAPYVRGAGKVCEFCDAGDYFKLDTTGSATAAGTCVQCPEFSVGTIKPDAPGFDVCVCNAGYERNAASAVDGSDLCEACEQGKFEYNDVCLGCGDGANTLVEGSVSAVDCTCDDTEEKFLWPFYGENSQIPDCKGASEDNLLICTACEPGKFSDKKDSVSACENCALGKYQYEAAQEACVSCHANKNTHVVGSDHAGACVCNPGYGMQICTNLINSCGEACDACPFNGTVYDLQKSTFIGTVVVQYGLESSMSVGTVYLQASTNGIDYEDCITKSVGGRFSADGPQIGTFDCGDNPQQYLKLHDTAIDIGAVIYSVDGQHPDRVGCIDLAMSCTNRSDPNNLHLCQTLCPTTFFVGGVTSEATESYGYFKAIQASDGIRTVLKSTAFVDTVTVLTWQPTNNLRVHVSYDWDLSLHADVMTSGNICTFQEKREESSFGSTFNYYSFNCHHRVGRAVWVYLDSDSGDGSITISKFEVNGRVEAPEHHWFPCVACEVGKAKSALSNALCTECAVGDYANIVAMSTCHSCAGTSVDIDSSADGLKDYLNADSTEGVGSTTAKDCVCEAGKGLHGTDTTPYDTSQECLACPEGFYKDAAGNDKCSICTLPHYGNVSTPPSGELHTSQDHCIDCPDNSKRRLSSAISRLNNNDWWISPADNIDDCECIAGATLVGNILSAASPGACIMCDDYHVKTAPGNHECNLCAANHHANNNGPQYSCVQCQLSQYGDTDVTHTNVWNNPSRSTADSYDSDTLGDIASVSWARTVEDCQCNLGFYKSDAVDAVPPVPATCLHCADGRYKDTLESDVCFDCAQNFYSDSNVGHVECTECPSNSGTVVENSDTDTLNLHDSVNSCVCNSGYEFDPSGAGTCSACSKGKARSVSFEVTDVTSHNCFNEDTSKIDRAQCSVCEECPDKHYQDTTAQGECKECDASAGSSVDPKQNVRSCLCGPGEAGIDANTLSQITTPWDATGYLPSTSDKTDAITKYYNLTCSPCALGKFSVSDTFTHDSNAYTQHVCMHCPPNMNTEGTGNDEVTDCMCVPGFEPNPANQDPVLECTECGHGYFKETLGNFACVACKNPENSGWTDRVGAVSRDECQCKAADGYVDADAAADTAAI